MIKDILRVALGGQAPAGTGWTRAAAVAGGLALTLGIEVIDAPIGLALLAAQLLEGPRTAPLAMERCAA